MNTKSDRISIFTNIPTTIQRLGYWEDISTIQMAGDLWRNFSGNYLGTGAFRRDS